MSRIKKETFVSELSKRLTKESPQFFKKVAKIGNWLTGLGLSLIGIPAAIQQVLPDSTFDLSLLAKIASYVVLAGIIITTVSKTTVAEPID